MLSDTGVVSDSGAGAASTDGLEAVTLPAQSEPCRIDAKHGFGGKALQLLSDTDVSSDAAAGVSEAAAGTTSAAFDVAQVRKAFAVFDIDGSGGLDVDEFRQVLVGDTDGGDPLTEEEVERVFASVDTNSNGRIEVDEWITWFQRRTTTDRNVGSGASSNAGGQDVGSNPTQGSKQPEHTSPPPSQPLSERAKLKLQVKSLFPGLTHPQYWAAFFTMGTLHLRPPPGLNRSTDS